ncbi:MAG: Omp28-related outer membrane protein [Bacteroidetes bacterium]|nr:Omp28-related outer membrane protein [Bacteroidota bacterium]
MFRIIRAIPVTVHYQDAMEMSDGLIVQSFYASAYPTATFNRLNTAVIRSSWNTEVVNTLAGVSSATVSFDSVLYSVAARQVDVYLRVTFTGVESGNLSFNCIVVEDSVYGLGMGYDQTNYFNSTVGHPYYNAGNPIVNFCHRHVARAYLGGPFGTPGIIPSSVVFGSTYQYHYSYVLPANFNEHHITLVGLVSKYDGMAVTSRYILNAETFDLDSAQVSTVGINDPTRVGFSVYPNPASDYLVVRFGAMPLADELEVISVDGKTVRTLRVTMDADMEYVVSIEDLAPGVYFINNGASVIKFVKTGY